MHISELALERRPVVVFLLACILAGGIYAFLSISKLEDPEIVIMQAKVITLYPGASAHEVELRVTDVLEKELSTLSDIHVILSRSEDNVSDILVELKMTVPQKEIPQRWEFMRRKVQAAIPKLPEGAHTPMIIDDFGDVYGMFYAMTAEGYSYVEMEQFANYVRREMLAVEGVNRVHLFGQQTPVVNIILTTETMARLGVFPWQIMAAISTQNSTVYPGIHESGHQLLRVEVNDRISDIEDLKGLVIRSIHGDLFTLGDIASIESGYREPLRHTMHLNNDKAMAIAISMESGENIIALGRRVEERMEEILHYLPAGVHAEKVFFQPDKVKDAIDGFMWSLAASVAIVILVLMLTMGWRSGVIIGIGLMLTVLATFPILMAIDGTLQRISLGAFIVAMGMLVDNAIVVIDGILVDMQKGMDRLQALTRQARRTAWPLMGATLIAVTAFLPVFLSQDTAGTYARDLFIVLCISLLISWLLAMTQVPLFAGKLLKERKSDGDATDMMRKANNAIRKVLLLLINHKVATFAAATILMALAGLGIRHVQNAFFPDLNYDQVYIEYILPDGSSPDMVNRDLAVITNHLLTIDEVTQVVSSHGMTPARYCLVRAIGEAADNYGELIVNFTGYRNMVRMKPVIEGYLRDNFPDAYIRIRRYNLSIKATHTVEVEFRGPDPAVLRSLSEQAQAIMRNNPYTDKHTINHDWHPQGKSLVAWYNQTLASRAGVNRSDVGQALLAATSGIPLGKFYDGQTAYTMQFMSRHADGTMVDDLRDIPVWPMLPNLGNVQEKDVQGLMMGTKTIEELTGQMVSPVPLSAVTSKMSLNWHEPLVRRSNGQRAMQAQCDPAGGFSPAQVRRSMLKEIEDIELPEGYSYDWVGEYELQSIALKNIFRYLPVSIVLILLTLVMLFNGIRKPAIVLLCIPLTAIGIIPGLIITAQPFTFMAIVGAIGLSGMLTKNAIVLLDEIGRQIGDGIPRFTALINATMSRTRPVIMASLTTMLGMLPLLVDPMYSSVAITIISGLLVGTIITLIFVPILYAFFFQITKHEVLETAPGTTPNPSQNHLT